MKLLQSVNDSRSLLLDLTIAALSVHQCVGDTRNCMFTAIVVAVEQYGPNANLLRRIEMSKDSVCAQQVL